MLQQTQIPKVKINVRTTQMRKETVKLLSKIVQAHINLSTGTHFLFLKPLHLSLSLFFSQTHKRIHRSESMLIMLPVNG